MSTTIAEDQPTEPQQDAQTEETKIEESKTEESKTEKPKDAEEEELTPEQARARARKNRFAAEHDMNDDKFDYVVLGTNLSENILAAGLAIQGSKCLLLDKNNRYGGHLSNFSLMHYFEYIDEKLQQQVSKAETIE